MNITVTWVIPPGSLPTDELYVYYKPWDGVGSNNWILAGGPLAPGTTSFTINNLDPNTVYRVLVSNECLGVNGGFTDESTIVSIQCPIISVWQGPDSTPSNEITLFYSLFYPGSTHVTSAEVAVTTLSGFPNGCPTPSFAPIGRTTYTLSGDFCTNPGQFNCHLQSLDFLYPSGLTSAVGYFGLDTLNFQGTCNGAATDPIIFLKNTPYKFYVKTVIDETIIGIDIDFIINDQSCITFSNAPDWNSGAVSPDYFKVSGQTCSTNCQVQISMGDGEHQVPASAYTYYYFTEDASSNQLPLVDNSGNVLTGANVTYNVYTPIMMSPALLPGQLGPGMGFELYVYNPNLTLAYTATGIDFTSYNWTQVVNFISNKIAVNTSYVTNAVKIGGVDYIKLEPCDVIQAYIRITGPGIFSGPNDIAQQPPPTAVRHGISDAFVYQTTLGDDFLYGSRGLDGNDRSGSIQITDIAAGTTTEVYHPIEIPINQMTLVDKAPPAVVYQMNHLSPNGNTDPYYCLNTAIINNPLLPFGHGFVYTCDDLQSQGLTVYNQSEAIVDSVDFNTYVPLQPHSRIRYVEANQSTGELVVLIEETSGQFEVYNIIHSNIGVWAINPKGNFSAAIDFILGSITTQGVYTVLSVTPTSIKVSPNPGWVNNQWSNYRIYAPALSPAAGQAILYNFPTVPNLSNDSDTLFINPAADVTFDASLLSPGDLIYMLGPSDTFFNIYDSAGVWVNNQYNDWDLVFEPNLVSPTLDGKRYFIDGTNQSAAPGNVPSLRITANVAIGGYYNTASRSNSTLSNLLPGVPYRAYRNRCGALFYSAFRNCFYFSKGDGIYAELDASGTYVNELKFADPTGAGLTDGAVQFAEDPITGITYAIMRDSSLTVAGNPATLLTSKDIYMIDAGGTAIPAIDGSLLWNQTISGRISYVTGGKLYFTSNQKRQIFEYDIINGTFISKIVPSVFKKSAGLELLEGAVAIDIDACLFVLMNRLANASPSTSKTQYLFTNLFVYDFCSNTITAMLIGADTYPFSASETGWNGKNLGEMFGEFNGFKDYCYGGMSVKTFNGKIYFKQYQEERYYVCTPSVETGVAQIWAIGENLRPAPNPGSPPSTYRLIRIFNIQSDGSIIPSKRTIFTYNFPRSFKLGPRYIKWDANTNHVVGVTGTTSEIVLIDPDNCTGYYGGPALNGGVLNLTLTSRLSLYTNDPILTFEIEDPATFVINDSNGRLYLFGRQSSGQVYNYQVYSTADLISTSPSTTATLQGNTGNPVPITNPGLYNTGGGARGHNYPTVFNPNTNTIWQMGNLYRNTIPGDAETDRIIKVFNATNMNVVATINLTALGVVTDGATVTNGTTDLYHNHFYSPGLDLMVYYGKTNDRLLFINPNTYTPLAFLPMLSILNLNRTPQLGTQNIGWMVSYSNNPGIFVDRTNQSTTQEFWTYIQPSYAQYDGLIHDYYSVDVDDGSAIPQNVVVHDSAITPTQNTAYTFGHYKLQSATPIPGFDVAYWNTLLNAGYPWVLSTNDVVEIAMFDPTRQLVKVENVTQGWVYDVTVPGDVNKNTLPTFNTKNSINFFAIEADNINLFDGDVLKFYFNNPVYPTCPFVNELLIQII